MQNKKTRKTLLETTLEVDMAKKPVKEFDQDAADDRLRHAVSPDPEPNEDEQRVQGINTIVRDMEETVRDAVDLAIKWAGDRTEIPVDELYEDVMVTLSDDLQGSIQNILKANGVNIVDEGKKEEKAE